MGNFEDFVGGLDPKTAKRIKTAQETEVIKLPLASYGVTKALNGGIAKGRITLIYGNQSSGKSLKMMQAVGILQKMGCVCAWVDVEGAYEKEWAAKLGVNNDELILIQSKSSAKIENEIRPLLEAHIDVIVIDSISDIMPEAFIGKDGSMNEQGDRKQIGAQAKAITALVNGILYLNEDTAVVLLSQTTTEIGQTYVKQIPHGGKKILFAASQIVKLTSSNTDAKQIKGDVYVGEMVFQQPIGRSVDVLVEKNKLGPQHRVCSYDMYYAGPNPGIDIIGEVVDEAIKYSVIKKAGAWFNWLDQKWQGRPAVVQYFKDNPDRLESIKSEIWLRETGDMGDE
jgi:recombination protein RecA